MIDKIKAVIDTNIIVSGIISPKGPPGKIISAVKDNQFDLITSFDINEEIIEVLHRPHIYNKYQLTEEIIDDICAMLYEGSQIVEEVHIIKRISSDPDDDKFLTTALEGRADYIVTGDPHLLNLGSFYTIEIVTARRFLEILTK